MNREIKYKFWLGHIKKMTYPHTLAEIGKIIPEFTDDIIPLQFTGLKDKNGKEIYEGDIDETFGVVEFKTGAFWLSSSILFYKCEKFGVTVIGNIYENPELLTL